MGTFGSFLMLQQKSDTQILFLFFFFKEVIKEEQFTQLSTLYSLRKA